MLSYLVVFLFFILAFGFFALMLHFSQYRQRENSLCCTDALDEFEKGDNCDTCPRKDADECSLHQLQEDGKQQQPA